MTKPERDAQELLDTIWTKGSANIQLPVDPFDIASQLGVKVYVAGLNKKISGMLYKRPGEDAAIYINGIDTASRQRFTCAHELGHYVKRVSAEEDDWEDIDYRDPLTSEGTNPDEIYANQFAACLLMPRAALERLIHQYSRAALTYEFGVSPDAINFRLARLKLA